MWGRITYQEVHAFHFLTLLLGFPIILYFIHLIFWLCYLAFGTCGNSHLCSFGYFMSEKVLTYPIISLPLVFPFSFQNFTQEEFHASDTLVLLSGLWTINGSHPFYLLYPMQDGVELIKVCASDPLLLSISYAEESFIYQVLCVWLFAFVGILCKRQFYLSRFMHFIFCLCQYLMWKRVLPIKIYTSKFHLPRFSY